MNETTQLAESTDIANTSAGIVVTDPNQHDNPITYVNRGFTILTGYDADEVVGRNCRLLQGEETDLADISRLREAIAEGSEIESTLVNYRKDGKAFLNRLLLAPIKDESGGITAYFGVMRSEGSRETVTPPETAADLRDAMPMLRELQHRVKNHLAMVVGMIRMQAGHGVDKTAFRALSHRIEALALLYDDLDTADRPGNTAAIDACAYLSRVTGAIHGLEARSDIEMEVDCDTVRLPVNTCAQLGLLVSELVTNALKHAFVGREGGKVWVRLHALSDNALRLTVEDDGIGMPDDAAWPEDSTRLSAVRPDAVKTGGLGGSIVKALTSSLDACVNVMKTSHGTTVTIEIETIG